MADREQLKREGYYISTPEYALMLGISTEALRSRRRRGELEGEYKSDGEKYWWKSVRPNTVKELRNDRLKKSSSVSRASRPRRRGTHIKGHETKYPNEAFKQTNAFCPIPSWSCHFQENYLSPYINWEEIFDWAMTHDK